MDCESSTASWKMTRLDEVCELRKDTIHPAEFPNMPYVGLEHIDSGNSRLKRNGIGSEVSSSKSMFHPGDILYGKLRPYLDKAVLAEFQGLCSTDILVLKSKESIMPQFLVNIIHTDQFLSHAVSTTKGVNHPRTSYSSLSAFQFLLPPLPEQRAISRVLRAVQRSREARLREMALERERKAALMEHLFRHGTRGEATKQTEIGEMPESWEIVELGRVFDHQLGKMLSGKARTGKSSRPYLRNANVQWGKINTSEIYQMDFSDLEVQKFNLKYGDILVCEGGEIGRTAIGAMKLMDATIKRHFID